jgi:hypothetical protein
MTAWQKAWSRWIDAYTGPFHREWEHHQAAGYMLDLVSGQIFDPATLAFRPVRKDEVFPEFMEPLEDDEKGTTTTWTLADAETALTFLVEQNMVVVDGDMIAVHPRFADLFADPPDAPVSEIHAA